MSFFPELSLIELTPAQAPWPLLLLADPSRAQIERYLPQSRLLALSDGEAVRGLLVLTARSWGVVEITNLAVEEAWQRRGLRPVSQLERHRLGRVLQVPLTRLDQALPGT